MNTKSLIAFITLLSLINPFNAFSQPKSPKAILVQVKSQHNRLAALERSKQYRLLERLKNESMGVAKAMINDFKDNFKYCPVYFYMDTNLQYIKERKFDGVLFDTAGNAVTNPVVNSTDTNYLVTYYGTAAEQSRSETTVTDSSKYMMGNASPFGYGFVLLNYKLAQVGYTYYLYQDELILKIRTALRPNHRMRKYMYFSKRFEDLDYYPLAGLLNKRLSEYDRLTSQGKK